MVRNPFQVSSFEVVGENWNCGGSGDFHQDTAFQKREGLSSRREALGGRRGVSTVLERNRTICAIPKTLAGCPAEVSSDVLTAGSRSPLRPT